MLLLDPSLFGAFEPKPGAADFLQRVGLIWFWLGVGGLLFRTVQLFFVRDVQTGVVWFTKILTDPFNDVRTYWKAPYYLVVRRQLIDPELG